MIDKRDFEKIVERKIEFIATEALYRIWKDKEIYKQCTGRRELATNKTFVLTSEYFVSNEDIQRVEKLTLKEGPANVGKDFCKKGEKYGEDSIAYSLQIKNKNLSNLKTQELFEILKTFDEKTLRILAFTWPTHPIARVIETQLRQILSKKINEAAKIDEAVAILTFPVKENTPVVENRELMKIALEISKLEKKPQTFSNLSNELKGEIKQHVEKFGFLGARGAGSNPWKEEDLFKRALDLSNDKHLKEKIEKSALEVENNKKETQKIVSQLGFTDSGVELVEAAKEIVYFRTYRTEAMYRVYSNIDNLLSELGNRLGYSLNEMRTLSTGEILNLEKQKVNKNVIKERQQAFGLVYNNGDLTEVRGQKYRELLRNVSESLESVSELKGSIACKGKVVGTAKICLTARDLEKVKQGDVLVTIMTTPDFVPAMQRAAAFVTNEGGITCHAAIVAREMQKPCIIGTKIATKVFKDGDLVEVNANKGTIKKL